MAAQLSACRARSTRRASRSARRLPSVHASTVASLLNLLRYYSMRVRTVVRPRVLRDYSKSIEVELLIAALYHAGVVALCTTKGTRTYLYRHRNTEIRRTPPTGSETPTHRQQPPTVNASSHCNQISPAEKMIFNLSNGTREFRFWQFWPTTENSYFRINIIIF